MDPRGRMAGGRFRIAGSGATIACGGRRRGADKIVKIIKNMCPRFGNLDFCGVGILFQFA